MDKVYVVLYQEDDYYYDDDDKYYTIMGIFSSQEKAESHLQNDLKCRHDNGRWYITSADHFGDYYTIREWDLDK